VQITGQKREKEEEEEQKQEQELVKKERKISA